MQSWCDIVHTNLLADCCLVDQISSSLVKISIYLVLSYTMTSLVLLIIWTLCQKFEWSEEHKYIHCVCHWYKNYISLWFINKLYEIHTSLLIKISLDWYRVNDTIDMIFSYIIEHSDNILIPSIYCLTCHGRKSFWCYDDCLCSCLLYSD